MKFNIFGILFFFLYSSLFAQKDDLQAIQQSFFIGDDVNIAIRSGDVALLEESFGKSPNFIDFLDMVKNNNYVLKGYSLHRDLYYEPGSDCFIFVSHCSKPVDNGTDWGLADYYFVYALRIKYDEKTNSSKIIGAIIVDGADIKNLKSWWKSMMNTYINPKYLRNKWAEDFDLTPPPPPPPLSEEWLKKK